MFLLTDSLPHRNIFAFETTFNLKNKTKHILLLRVVWTDAALFLSWYMCKQTFWYNTLLCLRHGKMKCRSFLNSSVTQSALQRKHKTSKNTRMETVCRRAQFSEICGTIWGVVYDWLCWCAVPGPLCLPDVVKTQMSHEQIHTFNRTL